MPQSKKKRALTLVELLLVTSLMAGLSVAVYHSFGNGIEVWKRIRRVSSEEGVLIFFDRLEDDLTRAMDLTALSFKGEKTFLIVPTSVTVPLSRKGSRDVEYFSQQPGLVRYSFHEGQGKIFREVAYYGRALKNIFVPPEAVTGGVSSVEMTYMDFEDGRVSKHGALSDSLPSYVRVRVEIKDDTGQVREFQRLFEVLISGETL